MTDKRLFELFNDWFPTAFAVLLVVALLLLIGGIITIVHFLSKWW